MPIKRHLSALFGLLLAVLPVQAQSQINNPGIQPTGTIAANDCAKFVNPFLVTSTGAACAGATAPGGSTTQLQYNNASAFGGISGWTTNGSTALTGGASTTLAIGGATIGSNALAVTGTANISGNITQGSTSALLWSTDLSLFRDAANTLAQRIASNAQRTKIYNTFTDASNGEWFDIDWITNANVATIGTNKNGTGVARALQFIVGGTNIANFSTSGHLLWNTDNTYDIGAVGASRPRTIYTNLIIAGGVTVGVGGALSFASAGVIFPISDGVMRLTNAAGSDFGRIQLGGTTSSFPAIGRSTTDLVAELADGTAGGTMVMSGSAMIGSLTKLTLTQGALGMAKITASASAPGAAGAKLELVCGTNAGTAKLIIAAGTSATAVVIADNLGAAVTGC